LYPDVWLLLTNSVRGDLEAALTGCPQRFGLRRAGRPRPLLTHAWRVPADFEEEGHHQIELWERFLRGFGLQGQVDRAPLGPVRGAAEPAAEGAAIGLIPGSENEPAKRWPIAHWRSLIAGLPNQRFVIFGTAADRAVAYAVASGFEPERVKNLAGQTSLESFSRRLLECRLLVTNDTGGMHLANSLGVPLIALFGPTNPVRTGPIFSAPFRILQPPGCPANGGGALADLSPEAVLAAVA
jgi:ADP-heptose:LPS heptosyltransferase